MIGPFLLALPVMAALVAGAAAFGPLPFVGTWDCEVGAFTFTETTYSPGPTERLTILRVERDGENYTLSFLDGYTITVAMNADGTMSWLSGASGDAFTCRRIEEIQ